MKKESMPRVDSTKPELQTMRLADLIPHPDQALYFRNYGRYEYEALKSDIKANGLKVPIEVMPAGNASGLAGFTILMGHTRRKALMELGQTETRVLVRHDLIGASRAEIDRLFLLDNVARRQQDRLGQARAAIRLYTIEKERRGRSVVGNPLNQKEVQDQVEVIVGMTGRNLRRYINVLSSPIEVQDAFAQGLVKLVDAARVVSLSKREQEQLVTRLRSGADPKVVFAAFFPPKGRAHVKPSDAVAAFARSLTIACADLESRVAEVGTGNIRRHEPTLLKGKKLIRRLLKKLDAEGEGHSSALR